MKNSCYLVLAILIICSPGCAQQNKTTPAYPVQAIAFPGAEGFGKYATGGRGGQTFIVTNLDDKGEGSFRNAAIAKGPRIIVFAVSGTIHLQSPLSIRGDATIAGQTAPGDGICIADHPVSLGGNNIIIRYLRFRMGDRYQNKGKVPGSGHDDALSAQRRNLIMIDHCSISWSTDECLSVYGGDSTTLQWNIISEPLNYSYHFEEGDIDFEKHGYGGIWGGKNLSAHHNLFAHCVNRNPRFNGTRLGATQEFADYRNNVIYNWGNNNIYGGEAGHYNVAGNYFKYGPSTSKSTRYRIVNPSRTETIGFGKWYVDKNVVDGSPEISTNNREAVVMGNAGTIADKEASLVTSPFPSEPISFQPASEAYESVLRSAGASFRRDTLDKRIIADVKNRTGGFINVQGGYEHGTAYEQTKNAWPTLVSLPAPADSDKDGMPDVWEKTNGCDPTNPADGQIIMKGNFYSNIERYINSLDHDK